MFTLILVYNDDLLKCRHDGEHACSHSSLCVFNVDHVVCVAMTGSMQLMAGVKLCTGRPITNHPHFEDLGLRDRTREVSRTLTKFVVQNNIYI